MTKQQRIESYDVYRGLLLTAMVVFHVLVNLTSISFDQHFFYWVPMGFVIFLGVIAARFLRNRTKKKLILALKILICFLVFNIPNYFIANFSPSSLIIGDQSVLSFEILMPMALVLLLSIPLDYAVNRFAGKAIGIGLAAILSAIAIMNVYGFYSYNLAFLLYGLVGYSVAAGKDLHQAAQKLNPMLSALSLLICFIPFLMLLFGIFYDFLFIPTVFAAYFLMARHVPRNSYLAWLGYHSFFIYVAHIFVIKAFVILIY